jgi:hypothetical protein
MHAVTVKFKEIWQHRHLGAVSRLYKQSLLPAFLFEEYKSYLRYNI